MDLEAKGLYDWDGKEITNFSEGKRLKSILFKTFSAISTILSAVKDCVEKYQI